MNVDLRTVEEVPEWLFQWANAQGFFEYELEELEALPTLSEGQTADLKFEDNNWGARIYLERTGMDCGEWCDNKVTVELRLDGKWLIVAEYPAG